MMDVKTRLAKARTQLLLDRKYVFWATVGLYQTLVEVEDGTPMSQQIWRGAPTMATDGRNLYYSPGFVMGIENEELKGVLAHEAGHCALGHHLRRQQRNPLAWNIACDLALNPILLKAGLHLPKTKCKDCGIIVEHGAQIPKGLCKTGEEHEWLGGAITDKKYDGMCAEEIYADVKITKYRGQGCGGYGFGGVMDAPTSGKDSEEEVRRWEVIIKQAAQIAKGQGFLPGEFEYLLKPITPKLDLHSMLRHMIATTVEDDYTWERPNRRHVWKDMYLPSQRTESVGDIAVMVDTSGSVSREDARRFIGVVNVVLSDLRPRKVYLVQCDAAVSDVQEFQGGDVLPDNIGIKGCGGTDMRPLWKWVNDESVDLTCAIVCSDFLMDVASFGTPQAFPVLWVTCTRDVKAPWGQTAMLDKNEED